jgi:hypothetical protein
MSRFYPGRNRLIAADVAVHRSVGRVAAGPPAGRTPARGPGGVRPYCTASGGASGARRTGDGTGTGSFIVYRKLVKYCIYEFGLGCYRGEWAAPGIDRIVEIVRHETVYVLHTFQKKAQKTPRKEIELAKNRLKRILEEPT